MAMNVPNQHEGAATNGTTTSNIGQLNATAAAILTAIEGLAGLASQIDAAAAAAGANAATAATIAINQARDAAINAIRATTTPSGNADSPKFQTDNKTGYGPQ